MIVQTKNLLKAATVTAAIANSNPHYAWAEKVFLFVQDSCLFAGALNAQSFVKVRIAEVEGSEGDAVIEAKAFYNLISKIGQEALNIGINKKSVTIKAGKSNYKLPTYTYHGDGSPLESIAYIIDSAVFDAPQGAHYIEEEAIQQMFFLKSSIKARSTESVAKLWVGDRRVVVHSQSTPDFVHSVEVESDGVLDFKNGVDIYVDVIKVFGLIKQAGIGGLFIFEDGNKVVMCRDDFYMRFQKVDVPAFTNQIDKFESAQNAATYIPLSGNTLAGIIERIAAVASWNAVVRVWVKEGGRKLYFTSKDVEFMNAERGIQYEFHEVAMIDNKDGVSIDVTIKLGHLKSMNKDKDVTVEFAQAESDTPLLLLKADYQKGVIVGMDTRAYSI